MSAVATISMRSIGRASWRRCWRKQAETGPMSITSTVFTAACVQMTSGREIRPNLDLAARLIRQAADAGAKLVMTPENTSIIEPNKPLAVEKALSEAEHPGLPFFAGLAKERGLWLLIGSMPIKLETGKFANRSFLFGPDGRIQARYDKIHMFD